MNDRREKDEAKLLAGAFHDDWANGPAADFARAAAAHARRRRAARRTVIALGSAAAVVAAALVSLHPRPAAVALPSPPKPAYEIISDDELIAALRDRPLLVVKKENGAKDITLIAPPPAAAEAGGDPEPPHVE